MTSDRITLLAIGDLIIERKDPETAFRHVAPILRAADVTLANCDQVLSDKGYPQVPWAVEPGHRNPAAARSAGVDVVSLANNHCLDSGPEALLDSLERLKAAGLPCVGAGANIAEARRPVILERKGVRLGFLAYCCIGPESYSAGPDRPGHAPVQVWNFYEQVEHQPGTPPRIVTIAKREYLAEMVEDIQKLRAEVDVLVVYFHWGVHFAPAMIPMYCPEVGHAAADAGADLVLGTHPHMLKGIEVYKGKAIFYSTGNFITELTTPHPLLAEIEKRYNFRRDPEYPTYPFHPEAKKTLIAKAVIEDGKIKGVSYIPCYINRNAEPEIVGRADPRGREVFQYVKSISEIAGLSVSFEWSGDEVAVLAGAG